MGLLTDPSAGHGKVIKLLLKYYPKLCVVLYVFGVSYFCLLASPLLNGGTYFSENALLPGLVKSEFRDEHVAQKFYEELNNEMVKYDDGMPYPWLLAKFRQLGLDTYTHNFTLNYPLGAAGKFHGKNVYAIIRAPRASSTESMILTVPYRPPISVYQPTSASIAIMLAFAKFAVKEKYWSKDIIFLVAEHEQLGVHAWLEAYHGVTCGKNNVLDSGDMPGRAGAIQAAINLELHDIEIGQIDMKIEGLNGQLPNLDLFNLVAKMCLKENINLTFKGRSHEKVRHPFKGFDLSWRYISTMHRRFMIAFNQWSYSIQTMLSMVATQATGIPNGNHGLFYRFGIQAITLEGFAPVNHKSPRIGFYTMGRILEGTYRSLNNLLEKFHQSYFFYVLPASDRYVSIGLYIPAICILSATLFIKAYAKWCQLHENGLSEKETPIIIKTPKKPDPTKVELDRINKRTLKDWQRLYDKECEKNWQKNDFEGGLPHVCYVLAIAHVLGISLLHLPKLASQLGVSYGYSSEFSVFAALATSSLIAILVPFVTPKPCFKSMTFLNIVALVELGTLLLSLAMYNISLGMVLATIYVPLALLINPSLCGFCNKVQKSIWLLVHPLVLLTITILISSLITFLNEAPMEILRRGFQATQKALVFGVIDSMIYGNWMFCAVSCVLLPIWLSFWYVSFARPSLEVTVEKKTS